MGDLDDLLTLYVYYEGERLEGQAVYKFQSNDGKVKGILLEEEAMDAIPFFRREGYSIILGVSEDGESRPLPDGATGRVDKLLVQGKPYLSK